MNHLLRELAPVSDTAWGEIDSEAERTLRHFLTARRLVDFAGPGGYEQEAARGGHVKDVSSAPEGIRARIRPYAVALGPRCYTGVIETTEMGGYPVFEHLRLIAGGPVLWAPAVDGAVVLSTRGGDYELSVGEDVSIGYLDHDAERVHLYFEETFTFQVLTPEAAVHLRYE